MYCLLSIKTYRLISVGTEGYNGKLSFIQAYVKHINFDSAGEITHTTVKRNYKSEAQNKIYSTTFTY